MPYTQYNYVWSACGTWSAPKFYLVPIAFLWPLAAILLSLTLAFRRLATVMFRLEVVALSYAASAVYVVGWIFGKPTIGAYAGALGVVFSAVAWIAELRRWALEKLAIRYGRS